MLPPSRRSRATTLLKTTTMQNVACAITSDQSDRSTPRIVVKALLSAIAVTMPGSAIGKQDQQAHGLLPKKR